jgi:hypothetical protein
VSTGLCRAGRVDQPGKPILGRAIRRVRHLEKQRSGRVTKVISDLFVIRCRQRIPVRVLSLSLSIVLFIPVSSCDCSRAMCAPRMRFYRLPNFSRFSFLARARGQPSAQCQQHIRRRPLNPRKTTSLISSLGTPCLFSVFLAIKSLSLDLFLSPSFFNTTTPKKQKCLTLSRTPRGRRSTRPSSLPVSRSFSLFSFLVRFDEGSM